ncbi:MAG: pseudouridine synthase [Chlorobi bacterium]|nr:pseudouridine synthase [Chlorobiota bacterium]
MAKTALPVIIHDDEAIIVIAKPPSFHTLPDRFRHDMPNVRDWLCHRYGDIYVVHRLDHDTSGVMVFARTAEAHRHLSLQFEHRMVEKNYHAIVVGVVEQDEFDIDIPLMADSSKPGRVIPSARGKESLTRVRVIERFDGSTLVACQPVTGRQHQVRVHLAAVGHPLLVDPLYGVGDGVYMSALKPRYKKAKDEPERPLISRATLHALRIVIEHPIDGKRVAFVAEYPKDFRALLQALRKYTSGSITSRFSNL